MTYEAAQEQFERVVKRMQEDLKRDAGKPWMTPEALKYRLDSINHLIEYYTEAQKLLSELDMNVTDLRLRYTRLFNDAHKLVLFAKLHNVNPDMIFHYDIAELKEMYQDGCRIVPPRLTFNDIIYTMDGETLKTEIKQGQESDVLYKNPYEEKYYRILSIYPMSKQ